MRAKEAQFEDPDNILAYLRNVKFKKSDSVVRRTNSDEIKSITATNKPFIKCYIKKEDTCIQLYETYFEVVVNVTPLITFDLEYFRSSNFYPKTILMINDLPDNVNTHTNTH